MIQTLRDCFDYCFRANSNLGHTLIQTLLSKCWSNLNHVIICQSINIIGCICIMYADINCIWYRWINTKFNLFLCTRYKHFIFSWKYQVFKFARELGISIVTKSNFEWHIAEIVLYCLLWYFKVTQNILWLNWMKI